MKHSFKVGQIWTSTGKGVMKADAENYEIVYLTSSEVRIKDLNLEDLCIKISKSTDLAITTTTLDDLQKVIDMGHYKLHKKSFIKELLNEE